MKVIRRYICFVSVIFNRRGLCTHGSECSSDLAAMAPSWGAHARSSRAAGHARGTSQTTDHH